MPISKSPVNVFSQNQDLQLQRKFKENNFGISLEGLPKGSSPAKVAQCIRLLEHVVSCGGGGCAEGEACRRTRQVLMHHRSCGDRLTCNVCRQLRALCRNHADRCQIGEKNCGVPYCKNMKSGRIVKLAKAQTTSIDEKQNRMEYHHVLKKLSEALSLPSRQAQLLGIGNLMETNRQVTLQVLRCLLERKPKSQTVASLSNQLRCLISSRKSKQMFLKSDNVFKQPNENGFIKLDVAVKVLERSRCFI